ncbi:MAG: hypothetical protein M1115_07940, partial [Actinobacteria bacterium]|nr:hypothetical protein [Actinomycetota bacterium]
FPSATPWWESESIAEQVVYSWLVVRARHLVPLPAMPPLGKSAKIEAAMRKASSSLLAMKPDA